MTTEIKTLSQTTNRIGVTSKETSDENMKKKCAKSYRKNCKNNKMTIMVTMNKTTKPYIRKSSKPTDKHTLIKYLEQYPKLLLYNRAENIYEYRKYRRFAGGVLILEKRNGDTIKVSLIGQNILFKKESFNILIDKELTTYLYI